MDALASGVGDQLQYDDIRDSGDVKPDRGTQLAFGHARPLFERLLKVRTGCVMRAAAKNSASGSI